MDVLLGGYPHFAIVFSDYNSIKSEYWDTRKLLLGYNINIIHNI